MYALRVPLRPVAPNNLRFFSERRWFYKVNEMFRTVVVSVEGCSRNGADGPAVWGELIQTAERRE